MSQLDMILSAASSTVPITQHPYQTVHARTAQSTKIRTAGPNKSDSIDISDEAVRRYNDTKGDASGVQSADSVSDYDGTTAASAEIEASHTMVSQQSAVGKTHSPLFRT
jgi:hypothetical protein